MLAIRHTRETLPEAYEAALKKYRGLTRDEKLVVSKYFLEVAELPANVVEVLTGICLGLRR